MLRLIGGFLAMMCVTSCLAMQGITDTLRDANQTRFIEILEQAMDLGLLDLSTGGPYTILVPTNDAFSRLTTEGASMLTSDATTLSNILKYHVIQGEVFSWDLDNGRMLKTINGHTIRVYKTGQSVFLDDGHVVRADLEANHAVMHLIDRVLDVPEGTIYAVTRGSQYPLSSFADLIDKAHLNRTLDSVSSVKYTVFAPSNDAFSRLPHVILERIQQSTYYLRELVLYHIHQGTLHMGSLDRNGTVTTLDTRHTITVTVDTDVHLNNVAQLEQGDIDCDNGVIHVIDHVLIPSSFSSIIG